MNDTTTHAIVAITADITTAVSFVIIPPLRIKESPNYLGFFLFLSRLPLGIVISFHYRACNICEIMGILIGALSRRSVRI